MITGFNVDFAFTDSTLPSAIPYNESIGEHANLLQWIVPDDAYVTASANRVSKIISRGTTVNDATQVTSERQPLRNATGAPNNRPSMYFDPSRLDYLVCPSITPVGGSIEWTKIIFAKAFAETTANAFHDAYSCNAVSSTTVGIHRFGVRGANTWHARVGTTSLATVSTPLTPETWQLVMNTWDGTSHTLKINVNGGSWVTSTVTEAVCEDPELQISGVGAGGSMFNGYIADVMLWNIDLSKVANAAILATVKQYFRDRYAHSIA